MPEAVTNTRWLFDRPSAGCRKNPLPFTAVAECRADHDLVVMERHFHLATLRWIDEVLALDERRISGELAHEEQRLELRERNECRLALTRIRKQMQLLLRRVKVVRVSRDDSSVVETSDHLLPADARCCGNRSRGRRLLFHDALCRQLGNRERSFEGARPLVLENLTERRRAAAQHA